MHLIPRTTLAQMDALSSQSNIAGYKAVLMELYIGKYMPLLMTAAGMIPPSKVVVIGAESQDFTIATAKRLGHKLKHLM